MPDAAQAFFQQTLFTGQSFARLRRLVGGWWVQPAIVLLLIAVLEFATFTGNFTGQIAPQWDFYNQYNTEAAAWWRDGSFFHPSQWMPYEWGGYPSGLDAQNSSFYLPVGLMSIFGPFTIHASAILSALHVGFGALGFFVLVRSWRVSFIPSLFGLVVWFFAAGFYSNASHLDIMRSWAWIPWIVLVIGATWRWNRWWRWLLGAVILWQGILAMYPGILVSSAYVGVVYVVVGQLVYRPRFTKYLLPLLIAGVGSVAMILLRYLPLYLTRGAGSPSGADGSIFSPEMWGTFLYPYGGEGLPNDITMRSFFLAAGVFALLPFAQWRSTKVRMILAILIPAMLLGLPFWPWHELARHLPGMGLSRFTMSDFKPYLLIALALIAAFGADRIVRFRESSPLDNRSQFDKSRPGRMSWIISGGIVSLFLAIGLLAPEYDDLGWIPQFFALAICVALIAAVTLKYAAPAFAVILIIAVSAGSGLTAQLATAAPWMSDRPSFEQIYLGAPVDTLVQEGKRVAAAANRETQRPARAVPRRPFDASQAMSTLWNAAFYDRHDSLMGYVNIKGAAPFEILNKDLFPSTTPLSKRSVAFWGAPGIITQRQGSALPAVSATRACVDDGACGSSLTTSPLSYSTGKLEYRVSARTATAFSANEAYYPGWKVTACRAAGADGCQVLPVHMGTHGQIAGTIPRGDWDVTLVYNLPGTRLAWLSFWIGIALILASGTVVEVVRRRRARSS